MYLENKSLIILLLLLQTALYAAKPTFHRDPFIPLYRASVANENGDNDTQPRLPVSQSAKLTGIIWDNDSPVAIFFINGQRQVATVGTYVKDLKLTKIYNDKVLLKSSNKACIVKVGKEIAL